MPQYDFDPATATTATDADEAVALAVAWADGRRSYNNLAHGLASSDQLLERERTVAVMDSEQARAWAAVAEAYAALEQRDPLGLTAALRSEAAGFAGLHHGSRADGEAVS